MFEIIPYEVVLTLHVGAFFINIAVVIVSDMHAALWVLGKIRVLPAKRMEWLHRIVSVGLVVSIATGAVLAYSTISYLLTVPAFYVKMALVAALCVNALVITKHLPLATTKLFKEVSPAERRVLFASGAISTASWVGVAVAAQFLGL